MTYSILAVVCSVHKLQLLLSWLAVNDKNHRLFNKAKMQFKGACFISVSLLLQVRS